MPDRALRRTGDSVYIQKSFQFESMNARQGIKTHLVPLTISAGVKFESMNARQGIKTFISFFSFQEKFDMFESMNARQGIKTHIVQSVLFILTV